MFWRRRSPAPSAPQDWRAHLHDAERYLRHDNVEEAAQAYLAAASGHPPDPEGATLWRLAGETFAYAMDRAQARDCYRRALALDQHIAAYSALAGLAEDDARERVRAALGGQSPSVQAPTVQDFLTHARPALEEALACYASAAALEPDPRLMQRVSRLHRWLAMDGSAQARLTRGDLEVLHLDTEG